MPGTAIARFFLRLSRDTVPSPSMPARLAWQLRRARPLTLMVNAVRVELRIARADAGFRRIDLLRLAVLLADLLILLPSGHGDLRGDEPPLSAFRWSARIAWT